MRKEALDRKFELAKSQQQQRGQQLVIDMAKMRNVSDKVALKAQEIDLKLAKAKSLEAKGEKGQAEALRIQSLASSTCESICNLHAAEKDRFRTLVASVRKGLAKDVVGKVKTISKVISPTYYVFHKQQFVSVACTRTGDKPVFPVWCSSSFRHFVFGGKSQMFLAEPDAHHNFKKLVERMLPAYSDLLSYEYHTGPLLRNNKMCLDLAFLEAVWRYSRKIGEKRFPCGDFAADIPFVSGPGVAGEASSSSSSAKPK